MREYISPEGLRLDGRRPHELRKFQSCIGWKKDNCDGSAFVEQGNTKVLVSIVGPHEPTIRSRQLHDSAFVHCEVGYAPFAQSNRQKKSKHDRRLTEMSLLIQETFESCILLQRFPRSQIDICVQVLQSDGSALSIAINAVTLALIDAGIPMMDFVCACSVGIIDTQPIIDLNFIEEHSESPIIPYAIHVNSSKVALLSMQCRMPTNQFQKCLELATFGCQQIYKLLREQLAATTAHELKSRAITSL